MSLEEKSSELEVSKVELSQKEEEVCRLQKLWETDKVKQEEKIQDLVRNFVTLQWDPKTGHIWFSNSRP